MNQDRVPADDGKMHVLLISDCETRVAMLTQQMRERGVTPRIQVMPAVRSAEACVQRSGRFRHTAAHDLVVVDFADPDRRCLSVTSKLAFCEQRIATPIVLLTSDQSESMLERGEVDCSDTIMFAPTSLASFLGKMREHSRDKFLRALTIMSNIGPVLVRLPAQFTRACDEPGMQQVA